MYNVTALIAMKLSRQPIYIEERNKYAGEVQLDIHFANTENKFQKTIFKRSLAV